MKHNICGGGFQLQHQSVSQRLTVPTIATLGQLTHLWFLAAEYQHSAHIRQGDGEEKERKVKKGMQINPQMRLQITFFDVGHLKVVKINPPECGRKEYRNKQEESKQAGEAVKTRVSTQRKKITTYRMVGSISSGFNSFSMLSVLLTISPRMSMDMSPTLSGKW
jgi:hypothetical protein